MKIEVLAHAESVYARELESGFAPKMDGDAGIDLRARASYSVQQGDTVAIPLGVAIQLEPYTVGWLTGRSSTVTAFGLLTHEGKIDSGYRGEIHALVTPLVRAVTIAQGERIAQLVVLPIKDPRLWTTGMLDHDTERGAHGLGSTGRV